jgi:hypothetical protein
MTKQLPKARNRETFDVKIPSLRGYIVVPNSVSVHNSTPRTAESQLVLLLDFDTRNQLCHFSA